MRYNDRIPLYTDETADLLAGDSTYHSVYGFELVRNSYTRKWELFDPNGKVIDQDRFRHNLAERHGFVIYY